MMDLAQALHKSGVMIVAGTDGTGLEIVHELELYVDSGFTPAEALQTATINPARLVRVDSTTGSVKVGKKADMVLVDGDPSKHRRYAAVRLDHVSWAGSSTPTNSALLSDSRDVHAEDEIWKAVKSEYRSQRGSEGHAVNP
jgi:imidazolonepropionase-like amidohydrolase